ncbi:MAG: ATP-binding protein [Planctomycetaceae bacterium]
MRLRERLPWGTLRLRLAAWNTAVVLAMTVVALVAARYAARATLFHAADDELRGGVVEVALAINDLFPDMDAVVAEMRRRAAGQERRGWFSQLLTQEGQTLWKSEHCPDQVAAVRPFNLDRDENIVQVGPYRYVRRRITTPGARNFHVRVGTYTTGFDASLQDLVRLLTFLGVVLCGLTPFAGWWLAIRATRPITAILETADRLEPTRLADRLPVQGVGDELDHLAITINDLLDDVAAHVRRQQEFLADAAHELRGPLAALQGSVEVALAHERDADTYREALEVVLDEARYLTKLANGLLLLAESGAENVPVAATPVNLADVVREAAAMFTGAAEDRGAAIDVSTTAAPAVVAGDPGQIRQVVGNLLDNAIRFTPPGGRIDVGLAQDADGGRVTLTVADSGRGIAAEHLPRLFDRFYKADRSRTRDGDLRTGGLGLPICKAIVERHGGTISLASRVGRGTTVTVTLPVAATTPPPSV